MKLPREYKVVPHDPEFPDVGSVILRDSDQAYVGKFKDEPTQAEINLLIREFESRQRT